MSSSWVANGSAYGFCLHLASDWPGWAPAMWRLAGNILGRATGPARRDERTTMTPQETRFRAGTRPRAASPCHGVASRQTGDEALLRTRRRQGSRLRSQRGAALIEPNNQCGTTLAIPALDGDPATA